VCQIGPFSPDVLVIHVPNKNSKKRTIKEKEVLENAWIVTLTPHVTKKANPIPNLLGFRIHNHNQKN